MPSPAGRLRQALAAYDEALELRRDVPLDYAGTQNNRAVLLSDLASLPGADRAGRLRQALADIVSALRLFEQAQHTPYLHVGRRTLAGLAAAMGAAEFRQAWAALAATTAPPLPPDLLLEALAEQAGISSQEEWAARLQEDPALRQHVEDVMALAGAPDTAADQTQALAGQLIAWIQTPDWQASEEYLQTHAAELLTDEAEKVLDMLRQANPDYRAIPQHQALLRRCREVGVEPAYQELAAAHEAAQDPVNQALAALFQVDSPEALQETLAQHPLLQELATLERLAGLVAQAQEAGQTDMVRHLLARLGVLLEQYNHAHAAQVEPAEQARFVDLYEGLQSAAEALDADLAAALRRSLAWALNTLGNAQVEQGDRPAAVESYTRAIGHNPEEAMLYRNRAGQYLELGQREAAAADVEQAAALEPDAPRLAELRQALQDQSGQG